MLLSPITPKRFGDCLLTSFHTRVFQLDMFDRTAFSIKNRLDDPRARHTGDIGDDLVELDVYLRSERLPVGYCRLKQKDVRRVCFV
jgi:hypothetical protein